MRRRGFTLVELLGLLVVMAAAATLGSALFVSATRLAQSSTRKQETAMAFDSALGMMRRDVWNAMRVKVEDDGATLVITPPEDGKAIRWHVEEGVLSRQGEAVKAEAEGAKKWERIGTGMRFEAARAGVVVRVTDGEKDGRGAMVMLASPLMTARLGGGK